MARKDVKPLPPSFPEPQALQKLARHACIAQGYEYTNTSNGDMLNGQPVVAAAAMLSALTLTILSPSSYVSTPAHTRAQYSPRLSPALHMRRYTSSRLCFVLQVSISLTILEVVDRCTHERLTVHAAFCCYRVYRCFSHCDMPM